MVEWIKKKTSIPSNKIADNEQLIKKVNSHDFLVIFVGDDQSKEFKLFIEMAKEFIEQNDIDFAHMNPN